jgi:hypothetical protein
MGPECNLEFDNPKGNPTDYIRPKHFSGALFAKTTSPTQTKLASLSSYEKLWRSIRSKIDLEASKLDPLVTRRSPWEAIYFQSLRDVAQDQLQVISFLQEFETLRTEDPDIDLFDALETPNALFPAWVAFGCKEYFQ